MSRLRHALLLVLAPLLHAGAAAGESDVWQRAYDAASGTRFIPLQLILGGVWDGERAITYPAGTFSQTAGGSTWSGPEPWLHPRTGASLSVYARSRGGRNAADQLFAVRDDQTAIGRVADSRFGISACDQEAKFPLGLWRQGETRRFEYTCWYGERPRPKVATITIREIDFTYGGWPHSLKLEWELRDKDGARTIDRKIYVFAPGRSLVHLE
jgi:hypothetical protein